MASQRPETPFGLGLASRILRHALLRLYPRKWRDRYGDELIALLDETGLSWSRALDLLRGAASERARALSLALLGRTGRSRAVLRRLADIAFVFALTWTIAAIGYVIGSGLDRPFGPAIRLSRYSDLVGFVPYLLPLVALIRVQMRTGWLSLDPLEMSRSMTFVSHRRHHIEAALWAVIVIGDATVLRLFSSWDWLLAPSQLLIVVSVMIGDLPWWRRRTALHQRLRRRQLYLERRPARFDA